MSNFTVKYNRTTNHIAGIACKSTGGGSDNGSYVTDYAQNACGSLTRGSLATGKSYATIQEAYDAAKKHSRRMCKNCEKAALAMIVAEAEVEAYDSLADQALSDDAEVVAAAIAEMEIVEGAEFQVGDEAEFTPSPARSHGAHIPAGKVVVIRVVDHHQFGSGQSDVNRFTYVVQIPNVPSATQGAAEFELSRTVLPEILRDATAVCGECGVQVAFSETKIVSEPIPGPKYYGQMTAKERRICKTH
jgi:transcription elongation factor Elf1